MRFHFIYNNRDFYYDYETGWIEGEDKRVPVYRDLEEILHSSLDEDTKVAILQTVLHAYNYGYFEGETNKLRDIRRVLGVNFD